MTTGKSTLVAAACVVWMMASGCASLDDLRQTQMALRNVESQKAELEQELYDSRAMVGTLRTRADSLEQQNFVKDDLIVNLTSENDGLEDKFRTAQTVLEKIAERPTGPVTMGTRLPAELDAALQQFASQNPSSVTYDQAHGSLKWTSDLVFAFASDTVRDSAKDSLHSLSQIMALPAAGEFDIIVVGHTDNIPIRRAETRQNHPTNRHLSVHRAISVANEVQRSGISAQRIGVMGFGEYRPIASNDSDQGRGRNRRVEMYIVPTGSFSGGKIAGVAAFTGDDPAQSVK